MTDELKLLLDNTPTVKLSDDQKWVVFSDLHLGDGGKLDDFLPNGNLFQYVLKHFYEKEKFKLVLNGDIDELHRFGQQSILSFWKDLYGSFQRFHQNNSLVKIFGNHDYDLRLKKNQTLDIPIREALTFDYKGDRIFIFHGHQAGSKLGKLMLPLIGIILRVVANALRIKNYAVAENSRKKYRVEKRIYRFTRDHKIITVIGHTHRPLFESLSKKESLRFDIEKLCRDYTSAGPDRKKDLEVEIRHHKKELLDVLAKRGKEDIVSSIYNSDSGPLRPCMFNSGCAIAKSGITSIEIDEGMIRLVYWFDKNVTQKYLDFAGHHAVQLDRSNFYRVVLKEDSLDYMFTRIRLLSD